MIKPVLHRLHRNYNVATAEVGLLERHKESIISCVALSNDPNLTHQCLSKVNNDFPKLFPEFIVINNTIELC